MKTYWIRARLTSTAAVMVEADSIDDALTKFQKGDYEVDMGSEEVVDWAAIGDPKAEDDGEAA